ncbi:type II toxin-antitoxin system RelE/ParE family toxin [Sphingopyxis indica]|uniref:type II toxin-antitoxin system RelE/ParE family toxin n=1 Tax=Sphingopyxis indica TaxID=436663 RepID=UPI0029394A67|nr:type II toxin-antitoxin system RelE/ParE family toxin [Sphingopyxis indica]WOF42876.1 type II toxin-antitoxin system RelE/ParE family toxin [Sphingopyxis indica]
MQTVVETPEYLSAARKAGMTDIEREYAVTFLASNPDAGDVMPGTGGCRKVRIAKEGKGKSGGYRVITYYSTADQPVFLLTVISKGQQANLTEAQKNELRKGKGR